MSSTLFVDTKSEQIFIGYSFFVLVLQPITTLSGRFLYYRVIRRLKFVKFLRVKKKKFFKKERQLILYFKDLQNLLRFFALFCFIFEPFQLLYFKIGQKVLVMFGLFFYRLMLSFCPLFLIGYFKIRRSSFIQKLIRNLTRYFKEDYLTNDEILIVKLITIAFLSLTELFVNFLKFCLILFGAVHVGQEYNVVLANIKDVTALFLKSRNFFVLFKDLLIMLKNQFFVRIQQEKAQWEATSNNLSRGCRICSWVFSIYFFVCYAFSLKEFALNLNKSFNYSRLA